jgi:predicted Rossmann fold flavoprotein
MEKDRYKLLIDLKPALSEKKLDDRILRDFSKNLNRDFCNSLGELLPRKMIPVIIERSGIPPETKCNTISREQRKNLVSLIKEFEVSIDGFRPIEEAIVTSGGVNTNEINADTLESKLCPNLYLAGEVLDVDGDCGGFNLQWAWSSGYAAGKYAATK